MDRRSTLATLLGRRSDSSPTPTTTPKNSSTNTSGLDAYAGPWDKEQAAHLLRRTMFGPTLAQIKDAVTNGMDATVAELLADNPQPSPPLKSETADHNGVVDPNVADGETWFKTEAVYSDDVNLSGYRLRSLWHWMYEQMLTQGISIREKMVLFWHNHFVVQRGVVADPKYLLTHINLFRENALGNFRELVKQITVDPSMVRYLNGYQNTGTAPNENYARELLELFTIGKGPLIGPGDYTTYTEEDVRTVARVLTGWRYRGYFSRVETPLESYYTNSRHDQGRKKLSERFGKALIDNEGEDEYKTLIDLIFAQDEVARFISRKLYRWFVYYEISDKVEQKVIEPMAQLLIANDYEVEPVIEALLKSEHFYRVYSLGPLIKSPVDFVVSLANQFEVDYLDTAPDLYYKYRYGYRLFLEARDMQMEYLNPPNVAGWKAYYQEPVFYQIWINSVTLPHRMAYTSTFISRGQVVQSSERAHIDTLAFAAKTDNPLDPNEMIRDFATVLLPQPLTDDQITYLKDFLIPGLPDFEWTVEYSEYLSHPDDDDMKAAVENKLRSLLEAMLNLPEYHLS